MLRNRLLFIYKNVTANTKREELMNFEWINKLISELPETSVTRENLIEIAGYPKWENVNSNLLAFYLDEKEEHGFNRLFLNSLLDLYEAKLGFDIQRELFETDYTVDREVSTNKGGRIDIVISDEAIENEESDNSSWSIIVENKLFADLYNNLTDYWKSIDSESKFGVVLSVNPIKIDSKLDKKNIKFINILHKELVEKVMQNLSDYYLESNDLHLLYLKEYIANVKSYYRDNNKIKEMDTALKLFHENKQDIEIFKKKDMDLLKHISRIVFNIFDEMGFPPYSRKDSSKSKHFQVKDDYSKLSETIQDNIDVAKKFRFWINLGRLRYDSTFKAIFELHGNKNTVYGDRLKNKLDEENLFTDNVCKGGGGKSGSGYQHILNISLPLGDFSEVGFDVRLKEVVKNELFDKGYIDKTIIGLKNIIETE